MKKNLLLVAVLTISSFISNAQPWIVQNTNFPIRFTDVKTISVPAPGIAWVTADDLAGNNNFLDFSRTIDGGTNWTNGVIGTDTTFQCANLSAINGDTAWACMFNQVLQFGGGIWKTTDGGNNWIQQDSGLIFDANSYPDIVHFWDANNGVAIGDPNNGYFEIYTTTNGGTNWVRTPSANIPVPVTASTEWGLTNDFSVVGNTIWFVTNKGRVYKSIDKGLNWTVSSAYAVNTAQRQSVDVRFLDSNNGLVLVNDSNLVRVILKRTTDGGTNWTTQPVTGNLMTWDLAGIPGSGMYMSTSWLGSGTAGNQGCSVSLDSGATWITIDTLLHWAIGAFDINNVWSGGFVDVNINLLLVGGIYKLDPNMITGISPREDLKAEVNAYPNPSTGIVNMNFKTEKNTDVNVSVLNMIGEQVCGTKFKNVSLFTHSFDFSYLPKGIYILNLDYGVQHSTQKLVIQ